MCVGERERERERGQRTDLKLEETHSQSLFEIQNLKMNNFIHGLENGALTNMIVI